jgi:esterase/lipase superfamily enzyme
MDMRDHLYASGACVWLRNPGAERAPTARKRGSGATQVDMFVATTRKPSSEPGRLYSSERGNEISLNSLTVSIPPDRNRNVGKISAPSTSLPIPRRSLPSVEGLLAQE